MRLLLAILLLLVAAPALAQQGQGMSKAMVVSSCGAQALSPGPLTNLLMNPQGQLCLTGIGGGVSSVWSAVDAAANGMTLSNGGLTVTPSGAANWQTVRGSTSRTSGKLYVEFANSVNATTNTVGVGVGNASIDIATYLGGSASSFGSYLTTTLVGVDFTTIYGYSADTPPSGTVFGLAIDLGAGKLWLAYNDVWVSPGNPAAGTSPAATFTPATVGALFFGMSFFNAIVGVWTLQPTAASQKYAAPAGFAAWN